MRIEIAVAPGVSTTERGKLLESLAAQLLETQNYAVTKQVRVTAAELDLVCEHRVAGSLIYVECKAHRDTLGAPALRQLLGTVEFDAYDEGWLLSAGPLGRDAEGFRIEWERKPREEKRKLSIYTPMRIVDALIDAGVIKRPPASDAESRVQDPQHLGDWLFLITPHGRFWCVSCLQSGLPTGVLVYSATTGEAETDPSLLRRLATTDTSLADLDFEYGLSMADTRLVDRSNHSEIVEVHYGESWADYRPARPEHFVGRKPNQSQIIRFLERVRDRTTDTRVFAVTGDSGMGKSSLIAKLRSRLHGRHYRNRFFMFAVDVRAAKSETYILSALLSGLSAAAAEEFGTVPQPGLRVTDASNPLGGQSITEYLDSLEEKRQVVCIVFDQFEELYSKNELFAIFEAAQRLFLAAVSAKASIVLGFAWRADSTVQQDHPAYYMWHRLADHRFDIQLGPFDSGDASHAVTLFQKELGQKLRPELRRQLIEHSRGYPWLLKKLAIHLFERLRGGADQLELLETAFDVETLFERDIQRLTAGELTCIRMIAQSAPADWYEVLDAAGSDVLRALQDKRLVVRSGDRLNLYWDIFREYVLTRRVPSLPFTYLPSAPSVSSVLRVAASLRRAQGATLAEIAGRAGLVEKTTGNVIRDLVMFGVATLDEGRVAFDESVEGTSSSALLARFRRVLKRHALTSLLFSEHESQVVAAEDVAALLKRINPTAQHREPTWRAYAGRMCRWLYSAGYLKPVEDGWLVRDCGEVVEATTPRRLSRRRIFTADSSPRRAAACLERVLETGVIERETLREAGMTKAKAVLTYFGLVEGRGGRVFSVVEPSSQKATEILWWAANRDDTIAFAVELLDGNSSLSGEDVGSALADRFEREWSGTSKKRIGAAMKHWVDWVVQGRNHDQVPDPPGPRSTHPSAAAGQGSLDL